MTMDRRFPFLCRIDDGVPRGLRPTARRIADSVRSRTGADCAYDRRNGDLFFYWGNPGRGVDRLKLHGRAGERLCGSDGIAADKVVRKIQRGRMPERLKQRQIRDAEQSQKSDAEQAHGEFLEEQRPEAMALLKHRRERRGMGRHYRGSAVIDKKET